MAYEKKNEPRAPDYKGDGVAVWVNEGEQGKPKYLSIKVLNSITLAAWKNVPKPKPTAKASAEDL